MSGSEPKTEKKAETAANNICPVCGQSYRLKSVGKGVIGVVWEDHSTCAIIARGKNRSGSLDVLKLPPRRGNTNTT